MEVAEAAPLLLVLSIFTTLPRPTAMQQTSGSTATTGGTGVVVSYSVALYVLIGIAVFYSMLTLICCFLVVLNCVHGKKPEKRGERCTPYRDIHLRTHLDTIIEESECSRTSSRISLPKRHGTKEPLSFSNRSALEDLEKEPQAAETPFVEEPGGTNLAFANKLALDVERSEEAEQADLDVGLTERGAPITTSFRNVVSMRGITGNGSTANNQSNGSPLMRYAPRSAVIPPDEVKVPFSEDEAELKKKAVKQELGKKHSPRQSPHHRNQPITFEGSISQGSPFHKRKNPTKEIPSGGTDLTDFRRKTSSSGLPNSNGVHPEDKRGPDPKALGFSHRLPPLARNSPKLKSNSVGVAPITGSPIRTRPIPKHPVHSSPSHSPFLGRTAQDLPSVATNNIKSRSSSSASNGSLTEETLLKELQPVKRKWYIIGTKLNLSNRQLNIIKAEGRGSVDKCLVRLCQQWLGSSMQTSWQRVVDALRSPLVEENDLANTLEQDYCWEGNSNSKTSDVAEGKKLR